MPQEVIVSVPDEAVNAFVALHPKWRSQYASDADFVEAVIKKRCEEECAGACSAVKQKELATIEASLTLDERLAKLKA